MRVHLDVDGILLPSGLLRANQVTTNSRDSS